MANRIVKKALIGVEDLLLGVGTADQERQSGTIPISKINATHLPYSATLSIASKLSNKVEVLENIAALQALDTSVELEQYVHLLGYTTAGDGGGGLFWLDTADVVSAEDLNIVFNPDVLANGRWKRVDTDKYFSADRGDADYAIQAFDYGVQVFSSDLTANRTVTLPVTDLYKGKKVSVLRTGGGTFNLLVGALATLTGTGLVELSYDGAAWQILSEPATAISASDDSFNGSFEIDSNNNGKPDNWALSEELSGTIELDSTTAIHGTQSLKFLSGGNGGGTAVSKRFDVKSGEQLLISFDYKSTVVNSLNTVDLRTFDINGNLITTQSVYSEGAANPAVFTLKEKVLLLQATAVTAELVLTGLDLASVSKPVGAATYFDNIKYKSFELLDEDNFASNSDMQGATQQSIKSYIDNFYPSTVAGWNLANAVDPGKNIDITGIDATPKDIAISYSGHRMYVLGIGSDVIYEYVLAVSNDISTAVYRASYSIAAVTTQALYIELSPIGNILFVCTNDIIYQFSISTPWDITTAAYTSKNLTTTAIVGGNRGIAFTPSGKYLYVGGQTSRVYYYTMSTLWDISTATGSAAWYMDHSAEVTTISDIHLSSDGTLLYLANTIKVYTYNSYIQADDQSTDRTLASFSYNGGPTYTPQEYYNRIAFNGIGTRFYCLRALSDIVEQRNLGVEIV